MKKKTIMHNTFKTAIFSKVLTKDNKQIPVVKIIDDHLVINDECCDLRTIKERYNPETKQLTTSGVDNILYAESFLTLNYAKRIGDRHTLYDFITVDCSNGNDREPEIKLMKDLLCYDGIYISLVKLEEVGYIPHEETEIIEIEGLKYVKYRTVMQSASENRQCKLTATTYRWDNFASTVSGNAKYLHKATQTAQKAIARQGLAKTNGNVINDFKFTFALVPDLETDITFNARCFYDNENQIKEEIITTKKTATDGCGFITSAKAKELAIKLELNYIPSAFQVRYGQVKGILLVFDFDKYSNNVIKEDILFTESMWKSDFDVTRAEFLVANISKEPRTYTEWNYQMFCTLNNQLSFDDILPYVEDIKNYMQKALSSPEDALKFLGILSNINSINNDESNNKDEYACVDKVSGVIQANPQLAMNIRWVKQSIKKKIDLVSKKMLGGKIPMPNSSLAIMGADPIAFFNRLYVDENGNYNFINGELIVPTYKQAKELASHEFYYAGYEGELLAFRNPLTHWAQIRKLNCVSSKNTSYWYRHLKQVILFNVHDETNLGMGGADFDGDFCFVTKLFVNKFNQADYIIYNNNDTGSKQSKEVLTEGLVQRSIRANLQQNMLGVICNINTRVLELLNDKKSLYKFVQLAGYMGDKSFGHNKIAQMPYYPKFKDMETATTYLERLNHELTTLSELEVDRPKTGYINRFCQNQQEYTLPYTPFWFANIKGLLEQFFSRPAESFSTNNYNEDIRTLSKNYDNKVVKVIHDTLKPGRYSAYIQRTIELMTDGNSIMGGIQRYIQENILDMKIDSNSCFSILETLKGAPCLDLSEAERIGNRVRAVYKEYCRDIAGNIKSLNSGGISEEDFSNALENIINISSEKLHGISTDRIAIAHAAYTLSLENGHSSQSFPFLTVLDGIVALLNDVKAVDYYDIKIRHNISDSATHLIVYNRHCRLPESINAEKVYFANINLPNGSYELHRDLKGNVSLIVPKPVPKNKMNIIPFNETAKFSLKVSYKASELLPENQNGEYVTNLLKQSVVTFRETTIQGNTQYCIYADDIWVGTIFDDRNNKFVLAKDIVRLLIGNEYELISIPKTGTKVDSNSFITSSGKYRTAQVLTFQRFVATVAAVI